MCNIELLQARFRLHHRGLRRVFGTIASRHALLYYVSQYYQQEGRRFSNHAALRRVYVYFILP